MFFAGRKLSAGAQRRPLSLFIYAAMASLSAATATLVGALVGGAAAASLSGAATTTTGGGGVYTPPTMSENALSTACTAAWLISWCVTSRTWLGCQGMTTMLRLRSSASTPGTSISLAKLRKQMLLCTGRPTLRPSILPSPVASSVMRRWSRWITGWISLSAMSAAAASTPACRMVPPHALRSRRALRMNSASPRMTLPTGAPRPLERHTLTVSAAATQRAGETPSAAAAFHIRAPSRCSLMPFSLHSCPHLSRYSRGSTRPPHLLWVCSTHSRRVVGKC
mmetsp:Transcript_6219/g.15858  ORF Transcript_6219/g.15858 Transcript_6219/m.15858 type:complete len:280 (-) Transcript_6219:2025-2864(-)